MQGFVATGFEPVAELFAQHLEQGIERGAALAAYHQGKPILDIWGGESRPGAAWTQDTVVPVFSTSKGAIALVVQLLCDRGVLDVTRPVAAYWPEFAANGKGTITLEHVLTHSAGLPSFSNYQEILSHDSAEGWDQIGRAHV